MADVIDIVIRDRIQASIARRIREIGESATLANSRLSNLRRSLSLTGGGFSSFTRNSTSAVSSLQRLETGIANTAQKFRTFASGLLLLGATGGIASQIDIYRTLQNQIRGVSDGQKHLNTITEELFEIAQRSRVPIDELGKSYRRFDLALQAAGRSQRESLDITETITKALTLSGASAGEASSALIQLSQAFNKGKLDGDEFRSLGENIPAVLDAISEATGRSRTELFKMSEEGELNINVLLDAFKTMKEQVDKDFEELPRTAGQGFTQLFNAIKFEFGKFAESSGAIETLNAAFDKLRNNLDVVGRAALSLGVGFSVLMGTGFAVWLLSLLGPFALVSTAILTLIAYLTYFADKIKISSESAATLQDYMLSLGATIDALRTKTDEPLFGTLFSDAGAQGIFDSLVIGLGYVKDMLVEIKVTAGAVYALFSNFNLGDIFRVPVTAMLASLINAGIEGVAKLIEVFGKLFEFISSNWRKFLNQVDTGLSKIGDLVYNLAQPFEIFGKKIGGSESLMNLASSLKEGFSGATGSPSDWGASELAESLRQSKMILDEIEPLASKMAATVTSAYNKGYEEANRKQESFFSEWKKQAEARVLMRKKEAEEVAKNAADESTLRQENQKRILEFTKELEAVSGATAEKIKSVGENTKTSMDEAIPRVENLRNEFDSVILKVQGFGNSFNSADQQVKTFGNSVVTTSQTSANAVGNATTFIDTGLANTSNTAIATSNTLSSSFASGARNAAASVSAMRQSMVNDLVAVQREITITAIKLEGLGAARNNPNNRVLPSSFRAVEGGFKRGGYTGNIGVNDIAGVVHGREFVMPAKQTEKYRPMLEAMRNGSVSGRTAAPVGTSSNGGGVKVYIENYGSSTHTVEQISANEVRIIASETVQREASVVVARQLGNPNSTISKALQSNTQTKRRR